MSRCKMCLFAQKKNALGIIEFFSEFVIFYIFLYSWIEKIYMAKNLWIIGFIVYRWLASIPSCDPAGKIMVDHYFPWLTEVLRELPYTPGQVCNDLSPPQIIDYNISRFNPLFPVVSLVWFTILPLDIILAGMDLIIIPFLFFVGSPMFLLLSFSLVLVSQDANIV